MTSIQKTKISLVLVLVGVVLTASNSFAGPQLPPVPDSGSSALLLSVGLGGLAMLRTFFRKKG